MGRKRYLALAMAMALGVAGLPGKARGSTRTEGASSKSEMAVQIYDGYLIVAEGSVGELHRLHFLLDTGTSTTAIDQRLAKRLGIAGRQAQVINFDKTVAVEWGEVSEISYGPEEASGVRVLIEDLHNLRPGGTPVDGIIGLDLLRRKSFLVDYARRRVVFGAADTGGMRAAPLRADGAELCVEAELDGKMIWMIADTGIQGAVLYERGAAITLESQQMTMGRSLGGLVESRRAIVPRFRLGGQDIERRVLLVSAPEAKTLEDVAGYLGPASLNAKQIVFDFEANELRWKK